MALQGRARELVPMIVLPLVFLGGCGTQVGGSQPRSEPTSPTTSMSPTSSEATGDPSADPPSNFADAMSRHGYQIRDAKPDPGDVTSQDAIEKAQSKYPLFTTSDPVSAHYFLVSTPGAGPLESPDSATSSVTKPTYQDAHMWVVYARAEMLKDDSNPALGTVMGTVVVFVDATSGEPLEAITY